MGSQVPLGERACVGPISIVLSNEHRYSHAWNVLRASSPQLRATLCVDQSSHPRLNRFLAKQAFRMVSLALPMEDFG